MVLKEVLLLAASVGFFIIWCLDMYNGTPIKGSYHWIMFSVGCLLYFQFAKNMRLKSEEKTSDKNNISQKSKTKKK
jgi:hypothetical protein